MRNKYLIALACLLLAGITVWWFLCDSDKARNILPQEATAVAVVEPSELLDGLGFDPTKVGKLVFNMDDVAKGIDLTKPAYIFMTKSGFSGITLNVRDEEKLLKVFSSLGLANEEKNGFQWVGSNDIVGCLDSDKMLLCIAAEAEQDALRNDLERLMKQSRQDMPLLERANRQKGFLRLCASLSSLPKSQLPPGYDASGAFVSAAMAVGNQDITLSARIEDENGKPYSGRLAGEELLQPIQGSVPTILPDDAFAWFCLGIKGEQLLRILRSCSPQLSSTLMALNVAFFDADLLLKAIDGDVIFMLPKADFTQREMLVTAHISNSDFLKEAKDWNTTSTQGGMSLRKRGEADDYVFTFRNEKLYFGVRGEMLYLSSSERLADRILQESEQGSLQPMAAGKYLCGTVDVGKLLKDNPAATLLLAAVPPVAKAVRALDKFEVTCPTSQSIELRLKTNEPVKEIMSSLW